MVDIGPSTRCNISPCCIWRQPNWCWPKCIAYLLKNSHCYLVYFTLHLIQKCSCWWWLESHDTIEFDAKKIGWCICCYPYLGRRFTRNVIHKAMMWCFFFFYVLRFQINYQYWLAVVVRMFDKSYDVSKQLPIIVITFKSIEPHDIRIKMTYNQNHNLFFFLPN